MFDTSPTHSKNRNGTALGYQTDASAAVTAGWEWSA